MKELAKNVSKRERKTPLTKIIDRKLAFSTPQYCNTISAVKYNTLK